MARIVNDMAAGPASGGRALKVTVFALPIVGHLTPMLPVVAELVRRGAQVDVVTGRESAPRFMAAGAEVVATYPEAFTRMIQRPSDNFVEVAALLASWTERSLLSLAIRVLGAGDPDVVVVDSMAPWGRLAALRSAVPAVTSTSSFLIDARLGVSPGAAVEAVRRVGGAAGSLVAIGRSRRSIRRAHGVDCGGPLRLLSNRGAATIVYTSRTFQPGGDRFGTEVHFVGPTAADRVTAAAPVGSPLHAMLAEGGDAREVGDVRPLAHVALGTIYNDRPQFLRDAALALAGEGFRVTVDTGGAVRSEQLGPLPAEVLCVHDASQLDILDHASLFVTHGGLNSVHEALWRSVPMIVFPQAADQPMVGARLESLGAGLVLRGREPGPRAVADAARALRSSMAHVAAGRIGDELRAAGGVSAAVQVILDQAAGPAPPG